MPLLNSVTTPYAEALLQVVNENLQTEEMVSEVKQLLELINDSPELEKALSSPILETDAKKKIIIEIFSNKVNSSLLNFLKFFLYFKENFLNPATVYNFKVTINSF